MARERSLLDRLVRALRPRLDRSHRPPPRPLGEGLWILDRRLRIPPALRLPTTTTLVRLAGGGLAVISPPAPDERTRRQIEALGRVEALIAPNAFHYLFVPEAVAVFASARLFVAPGLRERVPGLPPGETLSEDAPAQWAGALDRIVYGPVGGICEVAFLHRPTRTLVLTDLAFHLRRIEGAWNRSLWRLLGVPARFGPSRSARLFLLRDRAAARSPLARIRAWPFERIVVAHGEPVLEGAREAFERGFRAYLGEGEGSGRRVTRGAPSPRPPRRSRAPKRAPPPPR